MGEELGLLVRSGEDVSKFRNGPICCCVSGLGRGKMTGGASRFLIVPHLYVFVPDCVWRGTGQTVAKTVAKTRRSKLSCTCMTHQRLPNHARQGSESENVWVPMTLEAG